MRGDEQHTSLRIVAALLVVVAVVAGAWGAFSLFWPQDDGQIAMLRADAAPYKVRPDEPGGMAIPHQDKQVFNALSSEGKVVTVERILPGPEQPVLAEPAPVIAEVAAMTQAQVAAASAAAAQPAASAAQEQAAPVAPAPAPVAMGRAADTPAAEAKPSLALDPAAVAKAGAAAKKAEKTPEKTVDAPSAFDTSKLESPLPSEKPTQKKADKAPQEKPEPVAKIQKAIDNRAKSESELAAAGEEAGGAPEDADGTENTAPAAIVEKTEKPEAGKAPPANAESAESKSPSTGARFQLASFFDRPSAERAKAKLASTYASALSGVSLFIVEASIPGKGKVFRVQGSASDAAGVCAAVKAKGGTCVGTR